MKYFVSIGLFFIGLNCIGQDTAKHLSKSSVSFTGGGNITYPTVSSLSTKPATCIEPWASLSYNIILNCNNNYSFGVKFGMGVVQYRYNSIIIDESNGNKIGTQTLQQINQVVFSSGVFANAVLSKTISWYNELDFLGEAVVYYLYNPNAGGNNGYEPIQNFTNENEYNLYLYYYTGIAIRINRNITLTPLITFPLLNITTLFPQNISTNINAYNSLRTGIMITYNFNKK